MYFYEDPGPRNQIILFPHNSKREGSTNNITGNESLTWTCPSDINDEVLMPFMSGAVAALGVTKAVPAMDTVEVEAA